MYVVQSFCPSSNISSLLKAQYCDDSQVHDYSWVQKYLDTDTSFVIFTVYQNMSKLVK